MAPFSRGGSTGSKDDDAPLGNQHETAEMILHSVGDDDWEDNTRKCLPPSWLDEKGKAHIQTQLLYFGKKRDADPLTWVRHDYGPRFRTSQKGGPKWDDVIMRITKLISKEEYDHACVTTRWNSEKARILNKIFKS